MALEDRGLIACEKVRMETETIALKFSAGKDSVKGDSIVWVRINGNVTRTTPEKLLEQCRFAPMPISESGQIVLKPIDNLEIITASTVVQREAIPTFSPVKYLMYHDVDSSKEVYRLRMRGGREVTVTGDHSVMVASQRKDGGHVANAVPASSVSVGDNFFGLADLSFIEGVDSGRADWMLRLMGLWLADGCFVYNNEKPLGKLIISTGNNPALVDFLKAIPRPKNLTEQANDELQRVAQDFPTVKAAAAYVADKMQLSISGVLRGSYRPGALDKSEFIHAKVKANGDVWLCNKSLIDTLKELGLSGKSHTKRVPEWLFTASKREVAAFLAGYFDGDGCITSKGPTCVSVSQDLIFGIRDLLLRLGIESSLGQSSAVGGFRTKSSTIYKLHVGGAESIRRFIESVPVTKDVSKCKAVADAGGLPPYPFKVRALQEKEKIAHQGMRVYDFEVADNHMFVANNVLVHNSAAMWLRCREIFPHIVPIFHYWVPDLSFVEDALRMYEDYFKTEIIRMPHPNFLNFLADGAFQPPHRWNTVEAYNLSTVDYDEPVDWAMEDMGYENYWVAVGIKASDSPIRAKAIATNGAWTPKKKLFYPVADMKKADLIEILTKHKCPLSEDYNIFGRSFDGLQFRYINRIKEHYPNDYQKIKEWFPLVDAEFMRAEAYGTQKAQSKS